jgi:hypothetical protein
MNVRNAAICQTFFIQINPELQLLNGIPLFLQGRNAFEIILE